MTIFILCLTFLFLPVSNTIVFFCLNLSISCACRCLGCFTMLVYSRLGSFYELLPAVAEVPVTFHMHAHVGIYVYSHLQHVRLGMHYPYPFSFPFEKCCLRLSVLSWQDYGPKHDSLAYTGLLFIFLVIRIQTEIAYIFAQDGIVNL
jgi:hypothetical protein